MYSSRSTPGGYTYGIHITVVVLNIVAIGGLIWDLCPGTKSILWTSGTNNVGTAVALATTIISTIWSVSLLICTKVGKRVSHPVRISLDALTALLYLTGSIVLGYFTRQDFLWDTDYGSCNAGNWTRQQCREFWYALIAIELVAVLFGLFSLILTLVDIFLTVRQKNIEEKIKDEEITTGGYFTY